MSMIPILMACGATTHPETADGRWLLCPADAWFLMEVIDGADFPIQRREGLRIGDYTLYTRFPDGTYSPAPRVTAAHLPALRYADQHGCRVMIAPPRMDGWIPVQP